MRRLFFLLSVFMVVALPSSPSASPVTEENMSKLNGYAAIIGRAGACGVDMEPQFRRVIAWIDYVFKEDAPQYAEVFLAELQYNVGIQKSGQTGDSCDKVFEMARWTTWP